MTQPDTTTASTPPAATAGAVDAAIPSQPADVIHDIGYRHYDGPRLGRGYARRSLYVQSLRGAYGLGRSAKSKVLPMILLALVCAVAVVMSAVAIYSQAMTALPLGYTEFLPQLTLIVFLFVAAQAPQSVSRDLRFRTVPLYFSRPIAPLDYVGAKYAALTSAMFVFTGVPLVLMYLGALLAKFDFADNTKGLAQGLLSALLLSLLYAAVALLVAALTPRRGFGVAAVIGSLFVPFAATSAVQVIAFDQGHPDAVNWIGLASPTSLVGNVQSAFLGAEGFNPGNSAASGTVGAASLLVCLLIITGCLALLLRRYRKAGL
ncbi:ABC transporter permease [Streptomyces polyrhachis]|uniref:ABC transporter permease n=1 Tax=Streptomyces polyrhachis TaxID=1282885 RepID=A0ABW2GEP8_9ACTN